MNLLFNPRVGPLTKVSLVTMGKGFEIHENQNRSKEGLRTFLTKALVTLLRILFRKICQNGLTDENINYFSQRPNFSNNRVL